MRKKKRLKSEKSESGQINEMLAFKTRRQRQKFVGTEKKVLKIFFSEIFRFRPDGSEQDQSGKRKDFTD